MAVLAAAHLACAFAAARASPGFLGFLAFCVGGFDGTVLSIAPSLPAELLPLSHQRLAQAGVLSPAGVGFFAGPLLAAALRSASGDYASAALTAAACLAAGSALMAYLATLPGPGTCPGTGSLGQSRHAQAGNEPAATEADTRPGCVL